MKRFLALITLTLMTSALFAQTTTATTQQDTGVKQDVKTAGHATKQAAKKSAHQVKHTTKKAVHKGAKATKKGASKVEGKTQPQTPPPSR